MIPHVLAPISAALLLWLPGDALAALPITNAASTWAEDQATAAQWFGLTPFAWGWLWAAAFVAAVVGAWSRMPRRPLPAPADLSASGHRRALVAVGIGLLALYAPGVLGDFNVFDDLRLIHWDERVTNLTADNVRWALFENPGGNNMELMYLSFQLSWAVFGDAYAGWYLTNLALFGAALGLVHRLATRLLAHRLTAVLAVAFFGLSPIAIEAVAWMAARCHLFGLLFGLGSCVAYLESRHADGPRRAGWLALSLLAFALTQLSKPIFVFLPIWLVGFDLLERRRDLGAALAEKLPFALVAALFLRKMLSASSDVGRVRREYLGGSPLNTALQDLNHLVEYGRAALLPFPTGLRVPWNAASDALHVVGVPHVLALGFAPLASLVVLACAFALVALAAHRRGWRLGLFALLGMAASFAPVMNFPAHGTVFAYRYTLSAQILGALLLADVAARLWSAWPSRRARLVPAVLVLAWLAIGAWSVNDNRAAWRDSVAFWTRNAELYPHDGWSHYYAGKSLQRADRPRRALHHLERSARFLPDNHLVYKRIGDAAFAVGRHDRAREAYLRYFSTGVTPSRFYRKRLDRLGIDLGDLSGTADATP